MPLPPQKKAQSPAQPFGSEGLGVRFWRRAIFPAGLPASSFAADAFHVRVRDGNGWFHVALPPDLLVTPGHQTYKVHASRPAL
jgi:hypothetical protein